MQGGRLGGVVEPQSVFDSHRAIEDMALVGMGEHMIAGQERQAPVLLTIEARIADMQDMQRPPAQHDAGEGAAHPFERRIAPGRRDDPGVEGLQDLAGGAMNADGFRLLEIAFEEAAHGDLGGLAPALGAADAVGQRRGDALTMPHRRSFDRGGGKILVALASPRFRGNANSYIEKAIRPVLQKPLPRWSASVSARRPATPAPTIPGPRRTGSRL